jgi:hypothetical protein
MHAAGMVVSVTGLTVQLASKLASLRYFKLQAFRSNHIPNHKTHLCIDYTSHRRLA